MTARQWISSGSKWEEMAGYSRAVVQGDWIFVSGTVGWDREANAFPATAEAQARCALDIVESALREAGASLDDTVRVVAYLPDRADLPALAAVLKERLGAARPANTTVCSPLVVEGAKVEIEITALRRSPTGATP